MTSGPDPSKRAALLMRDGTGCGYCLKQIPTDRLTIDHRTPRCRGGTNHIRNLILCCRQCNGEKGPLTEAEYRRVMRDHAARKRLVIAVSAALGNGRLNPDGTLVVPRQPRRPVAEVRRGVGLTWRPFTALVSDVDAGLVG